MLKFASAPASAASSDANHPSVECINERLKPRMTLNILINLEAVNARIPILLAGSSMFLWMLAGSNWPSMQQQVPPTMMDFDEADRAFLV